jgi:hypothetical protein
MRRIASLSLPWQRLASFLSVVVRRHPISNFNTSRSGAKLRTMIRIIFTTTMGLLLVALSGDVVCSEPILNCEEVPSPENDSRFIHDDFNYNRWCQGRDIVRPQESGSVEIPRSGDPNRPLKTCVVLDHPGHYVFATTNETFLDTIIWINNSDISLDCSDQTIFHAETPHTLPGIRAPHNHGIRNIEIDNCNFRDTSTAIEIIRFLRGPDLQSTTLLGHQNITINDAQIWNSTFGVYSGAYNDSVTVKKSVIDHSRIAAIYIDAGNTNARLHHNIVRRTGASTESELCAVHDPGCCFINDGQGNDDSRFNREAISIDSASGVSILGNQIYSNCNSGIRLYQKLWRNQWPSLPHRASHGLQQQCYRQQHFFAQRNGKR